MRTHAPRNVLLAVAIAVSSLLPGSGAALARQAEPTVLFSVPSGAQGVGVLFGGDNQQPWGPSAIAVDAENTVWIADGVQQRVVGYSMSGTLLRSIDLADQVVGIGDIAVEGAELTVLDIAAFPPVVVVLDRATGETVQRTDLPPALGLESGLSGISYDDSTLTIELEGGERTVSLADARRGANVISRGRTLTAGHFEVADRPDPTELRAGAVVSIGAVTFDVTVDHYLGGIEVVGEMPGSIDIQVEEFTQAVDGAIRVDQTIRRIDRDGRQIGVARVPLQQRVAFVSHGVAVTPGGDILALVPRRERVDVIGLPLALSIGTVLPAAEYSASDTPATGASVAACRDRRVMDSVRAAYTSNSKWLSNANINGTCSGRTKPRYLGAAGTYPGVSYQWGGMETASAWNSNMSAGKPAGDIDTTYQTCAHGVDCSGYVQVIWGIPAPKRTATHLADPGISHSVPIGSLVSYDAYVWIGNHIATWQVWSGSGANITEATTSDSLDRTVYRWVPNSYLNNYVIRRLNNAC